MTRPTVRPTTLRKALTSDNGLEDLENEKTKDGRPSDTVLLGGRLFSFDLAIQFGRLPRRSTGATSSVRAIPLRLADGQTIAHV